MSLSFFAFHILMSKKHFKCLPSRGDWPSGPSVNGEAGGSQRRKSASAGYQVPFGLGSGGILHQIR
jgi:hypothetical protein